MTFAEVMAELAQDQGKAYGSKETCTAAWLDSDDKSLQVCSYYGDGYGAPICPSLKALRATDWEEVK